MPLNRELIGKEYKAAGVFEVGREHIRQFAVAIGDNNPAYTDVEAAKALGYPDVIAPPTFLTTTNFRFAMDSPVVDPALGLNYALVVHGEQRYVHHRPVHAGDRLVMTTTVEEIRDAGRNEMMTTRSEITTEDGEAVCTAYGTLVSRGTAGGAQ